MSSAHSVISSGGEEAGGVSRHLSSITGEYCGGWVIILKFLQLLPSSGKGVWVLEGRTWVDGS